MKEKVEVWKFTCERCGHGWFPRDAESQEIGEPAVCPKCKSPYWNKPRKQARTGKSNAIQSI